jgi:hypothetical protein
MNSSPPPLSTKDLAVDGEGGDGGGGRRCRHSGDAGQDGQRDEHLGDAVEKASCGRAPLPDCWHVLASLQRQGQLLLRRRPCRDVWVRCRLRGLSNRRSNRFDRESEMGQASVIEPVRVTWRYEGYGQVSTDACGTGFKRERREQGPMSANHIKVLFRLFSTKQVIAHQPAAGNLDATSPDGDSGRRGARLPPLFEDRRRLRRKHVTGNTHDFRSLHRLSPLGKGAHVWFSDRAWTGPDERC